MPAELKRLSNYDKVRIVFRRNNNRWMTVSEISFVPDLLFIGYKGSTRICEMQAWGELESKWDEQRKFKLYRITKFEKNKKTNPKKS